MGDKVKLNITINRVTIIVSWNVFVENMGPFSSPYIWHLNKMIII